MRDDGGFRSGWRDGQWDPAPAIAAVVGKRRASYFVRAASRLRRGITIMEARPGGAERGEGLPPGTGGGDRCLSAELRPSRGGLIGKPRILSALTAAAYDWSPSRTGQLRRSTTGLRPSLRCSISSTTSSCLVRKVSPSQTGRSFRSLPVGLRTQSAASSTSMTARNVDPLAPPHGRSPLRRGPSSSSSEGRPMI